ncbi:site-specific DNA-methyltransferase [Niveispirillum irakense]|uniref:site-specific DNA-methyltransferase n=1 Tax=Niveispirillum irakense TaxID=34011 RepID=UPI00040D5C3F|nr:site-specific DNA-methyltransferase [Niveispirillum irakense]
MPILNWLNRDQDIKAATRVPYRLLEEVPDLSAGDAQTGNMLIQGDNLDALKALLPFYAGQVKCIYIDPPYNTKSAFEHYDDNLEHSQWLSMMWPRLEILRELLSEDGSIWVSIDDNEGHYLKVLMDEVFGRKSFISNVVWQKSYTSNQTAKFISDTHDHIFLYAKNTDKFSLGKISRTQDQKNSFKNPDNDPRGPWKAENLSAGKFYAAGQFEIEGPTGLKFLPPPNRYWRCNEETYLSWLADGRITFGQKSTGRPMLKKYLSEMKDELTANTWWQHQDVGSNKQASIDLKSLFPGQTVFGTPKPETLLNRIIELSTNPGDLVLDSFLGSGTTAAVAHKMGRRYIGIEMGDHAVTHCAPRLRKVIEGEQGGISDNVGWKGGGGFRFYRLGPPVFDEDGQIRRDIRFPTLAAHIWFSETGQPWQAAATPYAHGPFLGLGVDGRAYALLYNGILGDKKPDGGNVLTRATLALIRDAITATHPTLAETPYDLTIYGEQSRLSGTTLAAERISFKQTPYDVKARA